MQTLPETLNAENAHPRRWLALFIVLGAAVLSVMDFFILNVSIPVIQTDLGATDSQIQWLFAGYGLAYAVFLITGGRLGDIYGRKRVFMLGVSGFTLASALCGLAPSPEILMASRVLQGFVAAIMFPQVLSIIQVSFPPHEKSTAFSIFGASVGLGAIAAQLVGGALVDANLFNLHWRPIFLVNLPIGLIAVLLAARYVPESRAPRALKLDIGGVALASFTLLLLMFPLIQGRDAGWPSWMFVMIAASLPAAAGFLRYEKWKMALDGSPLVELALFRDYGFMMGLLVTLAFYCGLSAFFMTMTLFLQDGLRFSATRAGYAFVPFAAGFFLASALSSRAMRHLGRYILNIGAALMIVGLCGIIMLVRSRGTELTLGALLPVIFCYGFGQGCVIPQLVNVVLSSVDSGHAGSAAGLLSTTQQVSLSAGVAAIGNVYFKVLGPQPEPSDFARALGTSLVWNAGLLGIGFVLALLLPRKARHEVTEAVEVHGAV